MCGQHVAQVGLGHHGQQPAEARGAHVGGDLLHAASTSSARRLAGEQSRKRGIELLGGRGEHLAHARDPGSQLLLGQRSLPAGVGVDHDQGRDEPGMAAVELQHDGAAPGQAGDVRGAEPERLDQRRQAVRVVGQGEVRGHVRRAARAGLVPRDDRELAGQRGELRLPHAASPRRRRARAPAAARRPPAGTRSRARSPRRPPRSHRTTRSRWVEHRHQPAAGSEPALGQPPRPLGLAVEEPDADREDRVEAPVAELQVLERGRRGTPPARPPRGRRCGARPPRSSSASGRSRSAARRRGARRRTWPPRRGRSRSPARGRPGGRRGSSTIAPQPLAHVRSIRAHAARPASRRRSRAPCARRSGRPSRPPAGRAGTGATVGGASGPLISRTSSGSVISSATPASLASPAQSSGSSEPLCSAKRGSRWRSRALTRLPHRPDPQLAVAKLGLGAGDARRAVAAQGGDRLVLVGVEAAPPLAGEVRHGSLEVRPAGHASKITCGGGGVISTELDGDQALPQVGELQSWQPGTRRRLWSPRAAPRCSSIEAMRVP